MARDMTEQEKLLALYNAGGSNPEAEGFDSADLLTQNLLQTLGRPSQQKIAEVEQEIVAGGDDLDYAPISSFSSNGRKAQTHTHTPEPQKDVRLIGALKNVHAGLIDVFERSGLNSGVESNLINLIDTTGACLNHLGEDTFKFEPLKHLSGLQAPDMVKNANKVVETTLNCYQIGNIEDKFVSDDGGTIEIVFAGKSKNIEYKAFGRVVANSWEGSEAIDYIYTPGAGKMSVKAFEGGKWVDKSDHYDIKWTLEEKDLSLEENEEVNSNNTAVDEQEIITSEKISEEKKEVLSPSLNNEVIDDDEEIGDFPISD
jgi:hypothetical protein